jgi:hypothetical protein
VIHERFQNTKEMKSVESLSIYMELSRPKEIKEKKRKSCSCVKKLIDSKNKQTNKKKTNP